MTSELRRDPFSRVYLQLRSDLTAARCLPGDQIVVVEVAARLKVSATPVREALARLAGERLVEDRRRHGYFVPLPGASQLRELYDLSELLCLAAIRRRASGPWRASWVAPTQERGEAPDFDPLGAQLERVLRLTGRQALLDAGLLCLIRLSAARRLEGDIFDAGVPSERLSEPMRSGDWPRLARAVRATHRRSRERAEHLASILSSSPPRKKYPEYSLSIEVRSGLLEEPRECGIEGGRHEDCIELATGPARAGQFGDPGRGDRGPAGDHESAPRLRLIPEGSGPAGAAPDRPVP